MFLNKLPIFKRIIPSIRKRYYIYFSKKIFWINIDNIFYKIDIRQKHDRQFFFERKYEEENFNFIKKNKFFDDKFIFIDIGCNIGIYSLFFAKNYKNCIKIISFEPTFEVFQRFSSSIKKNLEENIIDAYNIALSDIDGKKKMKGLTVKNYTQYATFEISEFGEVEVSVKKFDNLYSYQNKNLFIKCDVEGHELMIIKGMEKNLKRNNCLLQVEIFEDNFSKTNKQLENYGFRMLGVTNEKDSYFYSNKS